MRNLIWVLLAIVAALSLGACSKKAPTEQLLRDSIDKMQLAGEARDIGGVMAFVADDFSGQSGGMDRKTLNAYLMGIRLRTENIGVTRTKTSVTVTGERAQVQLTMMVTDGGKILPAAGQLVSADTQWRFVEGGWELASAKWTEGF